MDDSTRGKKPAQIEASLIELLDNMHASGYEAGLEAAAKIADTLAAEHQADLDNAIGCGLVDARQQYADMRDAVRDVAAKIRGGK